MTKPDSLFADVRQKRVWRTTSDPATTSWHGRFSLGRLQLGWHVHRHGSPIGSDRWVIQPFAIYDRRPS